MNTLIEIVLFLFIISSLVIGYYLFNPCSRLVDKKKEDFRDLDKDTDSGPEN